MGQWFVSYNSQDLNLTECLTARLRTTLKLDFFFAPKSLQAGGYWLPVLAEAIHHASAFILVIGPHGLGPWQVLEYYEALDHHVKAPSFPLVVLLLGGQPAPGLPFLHQFHWVVADNPASEQALGQLADAVNGAVGYPSEPWRHTAPYRGLAAMTEADSDFFFGRTSETFDVLQALAAEPYRMPLLIGNSGVGKSSLAQAGVLAALKRQAWPEMNGASESARTTKPWPSQFEESRGWAYLKLHPGAEPLRAIVEQFFRTWQFESTDPIWAARQTDWTELLKQGRANLRDLLDATERRFEDLGQPRPPAFFLYIDQGEELYVHAEERQRRRFSDLLCEALQDPRLYVLMSLRADFLGALQNDTPLFEAHHQISVPPLREVGLLEVVGQPAAKLGASFESSGLARDLAQKAAEESARDAGALPLLSYLLDDMWSQMVHRGDGILRLPAQAVELGGVLAQRANAFLSRHPSHEELLRKVLTLKLASVREDGEPTRRRATRSEFTTEEWRLICELADHPHRLLVIATQEGLEPYAEVAHEALFRRWDVLRGWIGVEREFLAWKTSLEIDRRYWEAAPDESKSSALLMGLALSQARNWLVQRSEDLPVADRLFVENSLRREEDEQRQRELQKRWVARVIAAAFMLVTGFAAFAGWGWFEATHQRSVAQEQEQRAAWLFDRTHKAVDELIAHIASALQSMAGSRDRIAVQGMLITVEDTIKSLVDQAPKNQGLQRSRATMLLSFGDIYVGAGETQKALDKYKEGLEIRRQLASAHQGHAHLQDVSVALERIGDVKRSENDQSGALATYDESLELRRRVAVADPACRQCQRDLSVTIAKAGDVKRAMSQPAEALASYKESLSISRGLFLADPIDAVSSTHLVADLVRVGSVTDDATQKKLALQEALQVLTDLESRRGPSWELEEMKEWRQLIQADAVELI